jgi:hyperosmotically inducible protein
MRSSSIVLGALALLAAGWLALPAPSAAFTPWGSIYEVARDERSVGDIAADKKIATTLKTTLLDRDKKLGLAVKVYCFLGKVTLLGQFADDSFKAFAENAARKTRGVKSVSVYWEAPGREDTTAEDLEIAAKIRAALVADKEISATQIEQEVFGGKVYLLGLVRSKADANRAVAHARETKGVAGVVNLLVPTKKK